VNGGGGGAGIRCLLQFTVCEWWWWWCWNLLFVNGGSSS